MLLAERWADRLDRRRAMAGAAGPVAAIVVLSAGEAVLRPALAALLPDRDSLPAADALFDITERTARLLGPGLVGLLGGVIPIVHFFTLDAATFLVSAGAVLCIEPRAVPMRPAPARCWVD